MIPRSSGTLCVLGCRDAASVLAFYHPGPACRRRKPGGYLGTEYAGGCLPVTCGYPMKTSLPSQGALMTRDGPLPKAGEDRQAEGSRGEMQISSEPLLGQRLQVSQEDVGGPDHCRAALGWGPSCTVGSGPRAGLIPPLGSPLLPYKMCIDRKRLWEGLSSFLLPGSRKRDPR